MKLLRWVLGKFMKVYLKIYQNYPPIFFSFQTFLYDWKLTNAMTLELSGLQCNLVRNVFFSSDEEKGVIFFIKPYGLLLNMSIWSCLCFFVTNTYIHVESCIYSELLSYNTFIHTLGFMSVKLLTLNWVTVSIQFSNPLGLMFEFFEFFWSFEDEMDLLCFSIQHVLIS